MTTKITEIIELISKNLITQNENKNNNNNNKETYEKYLTPKNFENLIKLLSDTSNIIKYKENVPKSAAILVIINYYLSNSTQIDIDGQFSNTARLCWNNFYYKDVATTFREISEIFLDNLFHFLFLKISELKFEAIELYQKSNNYYNELNTFNVAKAYLTYYAYQTKDFGLCADILKNYYICLESNLYQMHFSFSLMNYYKGIIFLAQEKFNEASVSFILSLSIFNENSTQFNYTHHQVESVKRLMFLYALFNSNYKKEISNIIGQHELLFNIKPLQNYNNLRQLIFNNNKSYEDYKKALSSNSDFLKKEKTLVSFSIMILNF